MVTVHSGQDARVKPQSQGPNSTNHDVHTAKDTPERGLGTPSTLYPGMGSQTHDVFTLKDTTSMRLCTPSTLNTGMSSKTHDVLMVNDTK